MALFKGRRGRGPLFIAFYMLWVVIFPVYLQGEIKLNKIYLEEALSIGSPEDDTFYMWVGIATDKEGYIYVTDAMDYSIKKFDSHGRLVKKSGRKGQGPGEFISPRRIEYHNGFNGNNITFPVVLDRFRALADFHAEGSSLIFIDFAKRTLKKYAFPLTPEQLNEVLFETSRVTR